MNGSWSQPLELAVILSEAESCSTAMNEVFISVADGNHGEPPLKTVRRSFYQICLFAPTFIKVFTDRGPEKLIIWAT